MKRLPVLTEEQANRLKTIREVRSLCLHTVQAAEDKIARLDRDAEAILRQAEEDAATADEQSLPV